MHVRQTNTQIHQPHQPTDKSQAVPHPNTFPARRCLTSVIEQLFSSQYEATQQIGDKRSYLFQFGDICDVPRENRDWVYLPIIYPI